MLYCSPPERDDEGGRFIGEIMKWWWPKVFPISLRNWGSTCHLILAVLHCHVLLTAVRVRSGGLNYDIKVGREETKGMFQRGCVAHQVFYWRNVRQRFWLPIYDMVLGLQWHLETRANYPCLLPEIETTFWSLFMTCRDVSWLVLSSLFWFDSAADPGEGLSPLPYFSTKMTTEGSKKIFWRPPPIPTYLRVWMTAPPLSDGLDPPLWIKSWGTGTQCNSTPGG